MSRRILLLLFPLLFAAAIPVHAQSQYDEFVWQDSHTIPQTPEPPWVADMRPNPRYPITVRLAIDYNGYNGANYSGGGDGHIFNPQGQNLNFTYRCGLTFPRSHPSEFYARWIKPGRKLEIRLRDPHSTHTSTCRISISPRQSAASASTIGSNP
jgi:hypothetical protein